MLLHSVIACIASNENSIILIFGPLSVIRFISLLLNLSSSPVIFINLIMMCLGVVLFLFLEIGFHWASWFCGFIVVIQFEKLLAIISLVSLWTPIIWIFNYLQFINTLHLKKIFFSPCVSSGFFTYNFRFTNLFLLQYLFYHWFHLLCFST